MAPSKVSDGSKGKATKEAAKKAAGASKRPLNSYMLFSQDERPKVQAEMPDAKPTQVMKELGRRWKEVDQATKTKYESKAKKARDDYSGPSKATAKKAEKAKPVEESEEEESGEESDDWTFISLTSRLFSRRHFHWLFLKV